ncbi:MAG: MFS transporter [Rhodobacteraceae bacterium]|nr:MFS transporter [Paracoccaceae bacterium]
MLQVFGSVWALLLGVLLLMLGNGMQSTLLGIRGAIEGFSTFEMSIVMSGYFVGFLFGSRLTPELIRRVGHVRVFAALASFVSAILILYPTITNPWAWIALRVIFGFCFSGVYVTAESWLNNAVSNDRRGQALSLYLIAMMAGVVASQGLVAIGDASGFVVFIIPSVLVSISFAPILLSINPTPAFEATKPLSLRALYGISPLGCVGLFLLGGVFSAQFGMAAVYGTQAGLSVASISAFIAAIYLGGLLLQYPIGWLSDRMDRRLLILGVAAAGGVACLIGAALGNIFAVLLGVSFLIGGFSNPLYALLIAYTNDMIDNDDMAAASGGLIFLNGLGAIVGPPAMGWAMETVGPEGFWMFIALMMFAIAGYAAWRMTRRPSVASPEETASYAPILPTATPVAFEAAQEVYAENLEELGEIGSNDDTIETDRDSAA